jgi:hypothetical protein
VSETAGTASAVTRTPAMTLAPSSFNQGFAADERRDEDSGITVEDT